MRMNEHGQTTPVTTTIAATTATTAMTMTTQ